MQLTRLIGATPLQVEITLLTTGSYAPTNVSRRHLLDFYRTWDDIKDRKFDGLIITGAPIETLEFEDVIYWDEMTKILDWTQTHVHSTFNICWGAQAALKHFRDVPKHELPDKMFGVFEHEVLEPGPTLLRGFTSHFAIPVSRHTETRRADLPPDPELKVLAESADSGLCLLQMTASGKSMSSTILSMTRTRWQTSTTAMLAKAGDPDSEELFPVGRSTVSTGKQMADTRPFVVWEWINDIYQSAPFQAEAIGKLAAE